MQLPPLDQAPSPPPDSSSDPPAVPPKVPLEDFPDHDLRPDILVRRLGMRDYRATLIRMQDHTEARNPGSGDEVWLVQHPRVYTLGRAGREAHILAAGDIPIVRSDRGGQVTYHGPGQLVVYVLIELERHRLTVRGLVCRLEEAVLRYLAEHNVVGERRTGAPGVYVDGKKIAALGLRIRRGCSYHGLSLNVGMELAPFLGIDPCGYPGLEVTQLRDLGIDVTPEACGVRLAQIFIEELSRDPGTPSPPLVPQWVEEAP